MKKFFELIRWFFYITTCVLFVCAANIQISGNETISAITLWQILLSGFFTALITVIFRPVEQDGGRIGVIKIIVHYFVLCGVMIGCGYRFGWMDLNLNGIVMMAVSVAVVYLMVFLAGYWLDKKQADEINKKLKGKYSDMK